MHVAVYQNYCALILKATKAEEGRKIYCECEEEEMEICYACFVVERRK